MARTPVVIRDPAGCRDQRLQTSFEGVDQTDCSGRRLLNEDESKNSLRIMVFQQQVLYNRNIDDALLLPGRQVIGSAKIVSPDITHKTDVGGVVTGINSDDQLRSEYDRLITRVKERRPEAVISGVSVQKMFERIDYELILGAKKDREFGTVILFGMGGVGVEIFRDFLLHFLPESNTCKKTDGGDRGF
jgi:acetyltransferase